MKEEQLKAELRVLRELMQRGQWGHFEVVVRDLLTQVIALADIGQKFSWEIVSSLADHYLRISYLQSHEKILEAYQDILKGLFDSAEIKLSEACDIAERICFIFEGVPLSLRQSKTEFIDFYPNMKDLFLCLEKYTAMCNEKKAEAELDKRVVVRGGDRMSASQFVIFKPKEARTGSGVMSVDIKSSGVSEASIDLPQASPPPSLLGCVMRGSTVST